MHRLRSLQAQILLWITLPLILVLVTVSLGSITLHQRSMRGMVAERDAKLARLAAGRLDESLQEHAGTLRTVLNALRHAHPKTMGIDLDFGDEGVLLTAEDDGAGFTPPDTPGDLARDGHFGLIGMYERATRLGGHLSIRSTPDEGTRVAAFLPYPHPS